MRSLMIMRDFSYSSLHSLQRMAISDNYLLKRIAAVMIVYCVGMGIWYSLDDVERKQEVIESLGRYDDNGTKILYVMEACVWGRPIFSYILVGLTGGLVLVVLVLCFGARKIPSAFNEGKYVFSAVATTCLLLLMFSINYMMDVQAIEPDIYLAIYATMCNTIAITFVVFIFVPKFKIILTKKEIDVSNLTKKIDADRAKSKRNLIQRGTESSVDSAMSSSTVGSMAKTGKFRGGRAGKMMSNRFLKSPVKGSPSSPGSGEGVGVEVSIIL